jgi:hypothetical protein
MGINRSMAKPMESSADSNAIVTLISSTLPSFLSRLSILEADSLKYFDEFKANLQRSSDEDVEQTSAVVDKFDEDLETQ